jgi:MoaA/NifB/PqqE/SkfB family radical SAM enzyme
MGINFKLFLKKAVKAVLPYGVLVVYRYFKKRKMHLIDALPNKVRLEASTICQLRCTACSFQNSGCPGLGRGYLRFSDYKKFVQKNRFVKNIELSNYGEIFLNPDLILILEYAFNNDIALSAMNGVNLNSVNDEALEALVKYKFRCILVSIDGASQEIYSQYRVNGNFDTVVNNLHKINKYKQKYNSEFPALIWQYVLMEHNEEDVIMAKKMAEELKMQISFKLTWTKGYKPKNAEMLKRETGLQYLSREEYAKNEKRSPYIYGLCNLLWDEPQINWDGRLLGCCCTRNDFGANVFKKDLKKCLNSKKYLYAKKMLQGKVELPKNAKNMPCANCPTYKKMQESGIYLERV